MISQGIGGLWNVRLSEYYVITGFFTYADAKSYLDEVTNCE